MKSQPCWVLASDRQPGAYLFLAKADGFAELPDELQQRFGRPRSVMQLDLSQRQKLAQVELEQVRQALLEQGWFLQLPPKIHVELNEAEY